MDVIIIGAGGHGRVVLDILRAEAKYRVTGFLDADSALMGTYVGGVPVVGGVNQLARLKGRSRGVVVAIGDNRVRQNYARHVLAAGMELINAVHPSAVVSQTATIGKNVVIAAGAVIGTEAKIGDSV